MQPQGFTETGMYTLSLLASSQDERGWGYMEGRGVCGGMGMWRRGGGGGGEDRVQISRQIF